MYLIIAEASVQLDQTTDAIDAVWMISQRDADLVESDVPTEKVALLDWIALERAKELFGEGHRMFDLRRTGADLNRGADDVYPIYGFDMTNFFYPIPQDEVNASGLPQSEGWEAQVPLQGQN